MNFWTKFSKKLFFLFNEQFYRMNNFTEIFMSDEKKQTMNEQNKEVEHVHIYLSPPMIPLTTVSWLSYTNNPENRVSPG